MDAALTRRHVLLVGLPGAGKTTVGRRAATLLGAPFADLDEVVAARAGKSVPRLFAEDGEPAFRDLEAEAGAELLAGPPQLLAPGGGYLTDEARRRRALENGLVIYLKTTPSIAARRLVGQDQRPLLKGYEPALRLKQLLERREAAYLEAHETVTTDGRTADQVAEAVAKLARARAGW